MVRRHLIAVFVLLFAGLARASVSPTIELKLDPPTLAPGASGTLQIVVTVPAGYHAQSATPTSEFFIPFNVAVETPPGVQAAPPQYPEPELKTYGIGEQLSVYDGTFTVSVPLKADAGAAIDPAAIKATVSYQICDDAGVCFAPQSTLVSLSGAPPTTQAAQPMTTEDGRIKSAAAAFAIAGLAGLIFNIMPCVLPVLPLKAVGFFEAAGHDRGKSMMLGLAFSVGMVALFALLAIPVLVLQTLQWGELFSKGWFVWPMVILLAGMAVWLFGAVEVNLPTSVYRFAPRHDTLWGNFLWGGFTAILATPCTAPLFPALLIWAAQQPGMIAVASMAMVGIGMAAPYLILSAMPEIARKMPRSGPWANLFKQTLAFGVLATAVYFAAGRLIDGNTFLWLVVATVGVGCAYLVVRGIQLSPHLRPRLICGLIAVLVLGVSVGVTHAMTRLNGKWTPYTAAAVEAAKADRITIVKFTANWCATCQVIEATVYNDDATWTFLDGHNVRAIKADLTRPIVDPQRDPQPLLRQLNPAGGIPLTAVYFPGKSEPVVLESIYDAQRLRDVIETGTN